MGDADDASGSDSNNGSLGTIASGAGLVFGGRLIKLVFGFLTQILMAQWLGVTSYGSVVLVNISLGVVGLFATLGLKGGLERNVPYFEDEPEKARGVVKAAGQIGAVASGLVAGGLFVAAPFIAEVVFRDPEIAILLRIAAIGLPFQILRKLSIAAAKGSRDAKTHVVVKQIVHHPLNTGLIALFILLDYGAAGAVAGNVLTIALTSVLALYLALDSLQFPLRGPTVGMRRRLLGFSLPLMLSAGMNLLVFQVDTILVGAFLESAAAGIYNIAFQFRSLGMFFFFSFSFLLPPVLTRLEKTDEQAEALRTYQITSKWMVFASLPIIVGFLLFPEVIIRRIFGASYVRGADALRVLMIPILITVLLGPNGRALVALGHNKVNMYVNGTVGLSNVALNVVLIPEFGILGAAMATATALVSRDVAFAAILYRRERLYAPSQAMLTAFGSAAVLSSVGYLAVAPFVEFTFTTALAWGLGFLLLYVLAIVALGGIESEDERVVSMAEERIGIEITPVRDLVGRLQR